MSVSSTPDPAPLNVPLRPQWLAACCLAATLFLAAPPLSAQELIYQEGFNTDGELATPPRYTSTGRDVFEVVRIRSELGLQDQLGPIYWAHNFEVSFAGVPAPTPARRALMVWDGAVAEGDINAKAWQLIESTVKWLLNNKAGATVWISPNAAAAQSLADRLTAMGHTVQDDDPAVVEANVPADLCIKAPGGNSSRYATTPKPVLTFSSLDHDDMLTSSIGATANFIPGDITVNAASHPAAGGLTGSFPLSTTAATWNLMGDILPGGATTLASVVREIPPTAASLADVGAMAAGTKQNDSATATVTALDFSDNSPGNWPVDNAPPGGVSGVFGLVAKGKLNVSAAGRYSFALGMDDGARLRIDLDKNGFGTNDNIRVEDAAGGHRVLYNDVTFPAAGLYDFDVTWFNSGGSGDLELSVSTQAGGGDTTALDSGSWELLGQNSSARVLLSGQVSATSYVPTGAPERQTLPFLVLLNGPTDTPPGAVFGGGPFNGFEGTGFFGMSGGNKWPFPDGQSYRSLTLRPVNVAGKQNVKLTIAVAATFLDFETSDFLNIMAYPNGTASTPVRLGRFSAPSGSVKYFADVDHGNANRLNLTFQDVTYPVPAGATDLVIELQAFSSWWNEIVCFDNIRITSGEAAAPISLSGSLDGNDVLLTWTGGSGTFLVQGKTLLSDPWTDLKTTTERTARIPRVGPSGFLRVEGGVTGKTVTLMRATLSNAAERPASPVPSTAMGMGFAAVNGTSVTYFVAYSGLTANATAAHIHGAADGDETKSSGVIVATAPVGALATAGYLSGTATVTAAQAADIVAGRAYFNIHTSNNPGGEIRGQLKP